MTMCYNIVTGGIKMSNINVRIDSKLKEQSKEVLEELGLDLTTGVRMFLTQVVRRRALPFEVTLESSYMEQAVKDITNGNVDTFNSYEDLMADLNDDD